MTKFFRCECGHELRGDSEAQLCALAARHIAREHPDLHAVLSRADLLAMVAEITSDTPPPSFSQANRNVGPRP